MDVPSWVNTSRPALVTTIFPDKNGYRDEMLLIASVQEHAPDNHLLVFDMRIEKDRIDYSTLDRVIGITVY